VVLSYLYDDRKNPDFISVRFILQKFGVPKRKSTEPFQVAKKLKNAGIIIGFDNNYDCFVQLNNEGIMFCKKQSFSFPNKSVRHSVKIIYENRIENNRFNHFKGIIPFNLSIIRKEIVNLKEIIKRENDLSAITRKNLSECLIEVENNIDVCKSPFYCIQFLKILSRENRMIEVKVIKLSDLIFNSILNDIPIEMNKNSISTIGDLRYYN
jgi:hypothetical protein